MTALGLATGFGAASWFVTAFASGGGTAVGATAVAGSTELICGDTTVLPPNDLS